MEYKNEFEMIINAINANDAFVRATISAFCTELNPTVEELNDVKTAVSEAFTNCAVHAYSKDEKGKVYINVYLFENGVRILIKDKGRGIENVDKAMQPFFTTKPQEERSGLGFTLMQTFMDDISVNSVVGSGTCVEMTKTFVQC